MYSDVQTGARPRTKTENSAVESELCLRDTLPLKRGNMPLANSGEIMDEELLKNRLQEAIEAYASKFDEQNIPASDPISARRRRCSAGASVRQSGE